MQRLLIYRYVGFTRSNTIMKWHVSTFPVVCLVSSERISSGRARMRNTDQTWCCTHMYRLLVLLLAFQQSAIAVVCQHQTAIMNASSFSYLLFDSWSKVIANVYLMSSTAFWSINSILQFYIFQRDNISRFYKRAFIDIISAFLSLLYIYFCVCYTFLLLHIYESNIFPFYFLYTFY